MKMKSLLTGLLCYIALQASAQKWVDMMNDPKVNFYDVQREAEKYFNTHGKGKGSGWKQYKRWEYEMQFKIDAKGKRLDGRTFWNAMKTAEALKSSPASNWTEAGPRTLSPTSSWCPGIGRVTSIAIGPQNSSIYVGSPGGGIWKSTNGGATWNVLTDNLTTLEIYCITIDPVTANVVYAGSQGGGILKTTDHGMTWVSASSGIPTSDRIGRILVDPVNNNIVLAATNSGIYRSTTAGASWALVQSGNFEDLEFKPGNSMIVYASGMSFYRSTNNGVTFSLITTGILATARCLIAVTPADPTNVYMIQAKGTTEFGYLYRSTNSGISFDTTVTGDPARGTNYFTYNPNGTDPGGQAWYDMAIAVSPSNAEEVHIGGILTWKSTNGGKSFVATTEWIYPNSRGYTHCDIHALEYVGSTLYIGSDGGIHKSTDGADNFINLSSGLGIRQLYRMGGSVTDPTRIAIGTQDNGSSIHKSGTWIDWLGADGMETMIDYTNADIIFGTSQNGEMYKTTNGGLTRTDLPHPPGTGPWITPFMMHPTIPTTLFVGYTELYKSTNSGSTWSAISSFGPGFLGATAIAPSNPDYIYVSKGTSMYVTKNGGLTWSSISSGLSGFIQYITVNSSDPEKIAVTTSGGTGRAYSSSNAGATWTNISGTLPALPGKCIIYQDGPEEVLYIALTVGVYYRDKTMTDWTPFMTNLPKVVLSELEVNHLLGKVRVATYGRGVWESDIPCATPTALSVSNITSSTATLKWGAQPNSPSFHVKWRLAGSSSWLGSATVTTNSCNISGLSPLTSYEFTVRSNCSGGVTAYTTPYKAFTTREPCVVPTGLEASDVSIDRATISWDAQSRTPPYTVRYKHGWTSTWSTQSSTTTSTLLTGLLPGTEYEYAVRADCPEGATAYSAPSTFMTIPIDPDTLPLPIILAPSFPAVNTAETLFRAYPNPTPGLFHFSFGLLEETHVELSIYDNMGKMIGNIAEDIMPAGIHSAEYNLDAPPGVYTCRLVTGNKVETIRLIKNR